jgi:PAS domain S-box-containing protein
MENLKENINSISNRLEDLFFNLEDVFYSYDVKTSLFTLVSQSCVNLFGISQNDFLKYPELWENSVYAEDANIALQLNQRKTITKKTNIKYRIVKNNGNLCWVEEKIVPFFDKNGNLLRLDGLISDINVSENLQAEVNEKNVFNSKLLEIAKIGYAIYNLNGKCTYMNSLYALNLNLAEAEIFEKNILFSEYWNSKGITDDFNKILKHEPFQKNIFILLDENTKRNLFIESEIMPILHKNEHQVILFVRDITESKMLEQQTFFLAAELQNLIQTVNVPIISFDKNKKITEWNYAFECITGFSKNEAFECDIFEKIIDTPDVDKLNKYIEDTLNEKTINNSEIQIVNKKGGKKKLLIVGTQRKNIVGNSIGGTFFCQDITEIDDYKINLEYKIEQRTAQLKDALKKEKDLVDLKSRFVSMASHEFRTPLAAINFSNGYLKKYWDRISEDDRKQTFEKIEQHIKHMTLLLDDVLTMGRLENGKVDCKPARIKLKPFLKNLTETLYKSGCNLHSVDLSKISDELFIYADEKLAINIFNNLLTNAIKFSPMSSKVNIEAVETQDVIEIRIRDFGIGISKSDLERIFEPFHRGENVEAIQGTGLGLSIVKQSVELHGGMLKIYSLPDKGTTVCVFLPKQKKDFRIESEVS